MASIDSEQDISADTILAGRYQVQSLVGSGGMATVYRATDLVLQREVALKVMRRAVSAEAAVVKRFVKEAQRMASLDSPYVVPIYDVGKDGPHVFLVMKLLAGKTLEDLILASGRLPPERAVPLCAQLLEGLAHLHARSLVHRDVKPSNLVVLEGDRAVLLDLGIARSSSGGLAPHNRGTDPNLHRGKTTEEQLLMGTPEYMSPERVLDKPVDARSDVYSVGVTLYEALTGQVPFLGSTPIEVCLKQMNEPPRRPSTFCADINAELEAVLLQALAKDPAQRYQTAAEMREALLDWSYGRTSGMTGAGDLEAQLLPIDMDPVDGHDNAIAAFRPGGRDTPPVLSLKDLTPSRGLTPVPSLPLSSVAASSPAAPAGPAYAASSLPVEIDAGLSHGLTPAPILNRRNGLASAWNGASGTLETAGAPPYIPPGTPTERIPSTDPSLAGTLGRPAGSGTGASRTGRRSGDNAGGAVSGSSSREVTGQSSAPSLLADSPDWNGYERKRRRHTFVALAAGTGLGAFALLALPRLTHPTSPAPEEITAPVATEGGVSTRTSSIPTTVASLPASAVSAAPPGAPTAGAPAAGSANGGATTAGAAPPIGAQTGTGSAAMTGETVSTHVDAARTGNSQGPATPLIRATSQPGASSGTRARGHESAPPDATGNAVASQADVASSPKGSSSKASGPAELASTGSSLADAGTANPGRQSDSPDPLTQARARLAAGDTVSALKLLDAALAQSADRPEVYRLRGDTFFRIGNTGAAIGAYRKYLSLAPQASDASAVRARLSDLGGL